MGPQSRSHARHQLELCADARREEALSRLQVGDAVRLLLMDSDGGSGWEKIYFEITSIDYYSKGQSGKARKFRGRAMDTRISEPVGRQVRLRVHRR